MANLITKETFKEKVVEGFIVGVMVSLTIAVCGIVWSAFDNATKRLTDTEDLLKKQSDFNRELLIELETEHGASHQQVEQLAADLKDTRTGLEGKLTELAAAINKLAKDGDTPSNPTLAESFGELERPIQLHPRKLELPDFKRIGRNYKDIVRQEPLDR